MATNCAYTTCFDFDIVVLTTTAQFLPLIDCFQQIQNYNSLSSSRADSNVINMMRYHTGLAQEMSSDSTCKFRLDQAEVYPVWYVYYSV